MLKIYYPKHAILQEKYLKHFYEACKKINLKLTPFEELQWNKEKDWATLLIYKEIKKYCSNHNYIHIITITIMYQSIFFYTNT